MIWISLAVVIAAELVAMACLGLTLDTDIAPAALGIIAVCISISLFYRYVRRDDGLSIFAGAFAQLICGSFALSICSYILSYLSLPLVDTSLISIDAALGFDWRNYVAWIDQRPQLGHVLSQAYISCDMQLAVLLPVLFFQRQAHGQRVYFVLFFAGMLTVVLAGLFPAVGAYIYYNIDVAHMPTMPASARAHETLLLGLLHHTTTLLPYPGVGLVTFPSYHTILAVALIYAVLPYRLLWIVSFPVNLLMILSTPFDGGHYLSDVLGGIAIALFTIYLAERAIPLRSVTAT